MNPRDLLPFLEELPEFIQEIILNLVMFIIAVLLILLLRWLLTAMLLRPLRVIVRRTDSDLDDVLLEESVTPMRIAVVGFALIFTVNLFSFGVEIQQIAETIGRTLLIGSVFYGLIKFFGVVSLQPTAFRQVTGLTIPERLLPFLNTVVRYLIIALGAIFVLQELNFDVAALIASLGVVGIGISLASQDTVGNMFGFAAIVSDDPFKVGDFIKTPNLTGIVESVGVRSTRVRQLDQALLTVPNNLLTNAVVLNWSRMEKRRLNVTLTLTYGTTSDQMRAVVSEIREFLQQTENVDPDSVIVHFVDFSASSLDVLVICQVLLADWRQFTALKESLYLEIMGIVERLGLSFAFPSQSLYIESTPDSKDDDVLFSGQREEILALKAQMDDKQAADADGPGTAVGSAEP